MSKLAEFRQAKVAADSVAAAANGVGDKTVTATVASGAFSAGSETVNIHIRFHKKDALVASHVLANCMAKAIERNLDTLLAEAVIEAGAVVVAAKSAAVAEAQEVLREVGP